MKIMEWKMKNEFESIENKIIEADSIEFVLKTLFESIQFESKNRENLLLSIYILFKLLCEIEKIDYDYELIRDIMEDEIYYDCFIGRYNDVLKERDEVIYYKARIKKLTNKLIEEKDASISLLIREVIQEIKTKSLNTILNVEIMDDILEEYFMGIISSDEMIFRFKHIVNLTK